MDKPNVSFNAEEKFILDNFITVHNGKSWFANSTALPYGTRGK